MSVWKKLFLVLFFMSTMYFGGLSIQSDSALAQGFGFVVVIIAFILLYVISKVMWRSMGFVSSFCIIGSVVIFILYSLGLIGQGRLNSFVSGRQTDTVALNDDAAFDYADLEAEVSGRKRKRTDTQVPSEVTAEQAYPSSQQSDAAYMETESDSFLDKIKSFFGRNNNSGLAADFNPTEYPYIEGQVSVITASVLRMNGIYIKLLGIDAPDPEQTCADRHGGPYRCGQRALTWLQNWVQDQILKCHIVGKVERNRATGVCFTSDGKYDVAAVVTNAGWAVAYTQNTAIYVPYEEQAALNRRGLWSGRFYKPWDWRRIQNRKVKITITRSKSGGSGFMDWLSGLF